MSMGIICRDPATGAVTYDSRQENTLFLIAEQAIAGSSVGTGAGLTLTYPAYTGKKIVANMISPYQTGEIDGWAVLSCRVTYPGGVPTVRVFVDNAATALPLCDGMLLIYYTGASQ